MANSDLSRLLQSDEIQKCLRPRRTRIYRKMVKRNPLKNPGIMGFLNPFAPVLKQRNKAALLKIQTAKEVLRRRRSGEKVTDVELANARKVLKISLEKKSKKAVSKKPKKAEVAKTSK